MRVTLVHNPDAGEDDHAGETLRSRVAEAGHHVSYVSMAQPRWLEELAETGDLVVVAGGDGSVGKVFRELATKEVPVTLLPFGSANNLARALGIDDADVERIVRGWSDGEARRFDVGEASASWGRAQFVESLGGGLLGGVMVRADRIEKVGGVDVEGEEKVDLGLELLRDAIEDRSASRWHVQADGEDLSGEYLAVEVMNIGEMGPNLPLAPDADPGDGLLDVVLVRPDDRAGLLAYLAQRLRELDADPPALDVRRGEQIVLGPPEDVRLHLDDRLWPEDPAEPRPGNVVVTCARSFPILVPRL
jgi:diacylglycerol kinase family enzyme